MLWGLNKKQWAARAIFSVSSALVPTAIAVSAKYGASAASTIVNWLTENASIGSAAGDIGVYLGVGGIVAGGMGYLVTVGVDRCCCKPKAVADTTAEKLLTDKTADSEENQEHNVAINAEVTGHSRHRLSHALQHVQTENQSIADAYYAVLKLISERKNELAKAAQKEFIEQYEESLAPVVVHSISNGQMQERKVLAKQLAQELSEIRIDVKVSLAPKNTGPTSQQHNQFFAKSLQGTKSPKLTAEEKQTRQKRADLLARKYEEILQYAAQRNSIKAKAARILLLAKPELQEFASVQVTVQSGYDEKQQRLGATQTISLKTLQERLIGLTPNEIEEEIKLIDNDIIEHEFAAAQNKLKMLQIKLTEYGYLGIDVNGQPGKGFQQYFDLDMHVIVRQYNMIAARVQKETLPLVYSSPINNNREKEGLSGSQKQENVTSFSVPNNNSI